MHSTVFCEDAIFQCGKNKNVIANIGVAFKITEHSLGKKMNHLTFNELAAVSELHEAM